MSNFEQIGNVARPARQYGFRRRHRRYHVLSAFFRIRQQVLDPVTTRIARLGRGLDSRHSRAGLLWLSTAANKASTAFTQAWGYERAAAARKAAADAGIEVISASQDMIDATNAFRKTDLDSAIQIATDNLKVTDAAAKIARFQELVAKWTTIVEGANGDADAIAAKVQEEVWDKVDYAAYGL